MTDSAIFRGWKRPKRPLKSWDKWFLGQAILISKKSKDPSTKVGAVLVDQENRPLSNGFNGPPRKVRDSSDRLYHRETKLKIVLHAEHNAVLLAERAISGCSCYLWPLPPCAHCASILIQKEVLRVIAPEPSKEAIDRWGKDLILSEELFKEASVELVIIPRECPEYKSLLDFDMACSNFFP